MRPTSLHSGSHTATVRFAGGPTARPSSLGRVSPPRDSNCFPTQHGRLGMNQVPVQEGGFARRAEVPCFLSPRAGPGKPMSHAHLSVGRWIRNRRSTCTTKITYLGSVSMTIFPRKSAKVVRSNVKLRLNVETLDRSSYVAARYRRAPWQPTGCGCAIHEQKGMFDRHVSAILLKLGVRSSAEARLPCWSTPSTIRLHNATPSVFHQHHSGRVLRSSCNCCGRRVASSRGREHRPGRCPPVWPGDLRNDGGSVSAAGADGGEA